MYICKSNAVNSFFGKLENGCVLKKDGIVVVNNPQAEDMVTCGYLRKMTEYELNKDKPQTCQDVVTEKVSEDVNKEVQTKVVNNKPRRNKRRKK